MPSNLRPAFDRPKIGKLEIATLKGAIGEKLPLGTVGDLDLCLLDVASEEFITFYQKLKANPGPDNPEKGKIEREVKAESFRLYALLVVRMQTEAQIQAISDALTTHFFDKTGDIGPFSAIAIFMAMNFSGMIEDHTDPEKVKNHTQGPGPSQYLTGSAEVANREKKERQQKTLAEIIQKLQSSKLPEFA